VAGRSLLAPFLAAVTGGVALGLAARAGDRVPLGTVHLLTALGGPWLVVAFAAGALGPPDRRVAAAVRGATAIVAGVLTYYVSMWRIERLTGPGYAVPVAVAWSLGGAVVGACLGWLGARWRGSEVGVRASWAALLCGALLGEAVLLHELWSGRSADRAVGAQVLGAAMLLGLLAPRPRTWPAALPVLAASTATCAVAALLLRESARAAGWAGA